jgi:hypothetical protein
MKNRVLTGCLVFFALSLFSQNTQYKLFRPTILQVCTKFDDKLIQNGLESLVKEQLFEMADVINITNPILNYKSNISLSDLSGVAKECVAVWFARDKNGYMSDENLKIRAGYTAAFEDIIINNQAQISRLVNIANDLIPKSYIVLFHLKDIEDYKTIYDKYERNSQAVIRKNFGYALNYEVIICKIDWNEQVRNEFYNHYYVDSLMSSSTPIEEQIREKKSKINSFDNFKIGLTQKYSYSLSVESTIDVYMSYELEESNIFRKLTKATYDPKTKKEILVDYEKKGEEAMKTKNYLAAEKCFQVAFKNDPKNKNLPGKILNAHNEIILLFRKKEEDNLKNIALITQVKSRFAGLIKGQVLYRVSDDLRLSDDFKVATAVSEVKRTKVKLPIGTKEGLQVGDRYVAYELIEKNGIVSKQYVGYCRATKRMAQNLGRVSGYSLKQGELDHDFLLYNTSNSIFRQQSGKKLSQGMLLEFEADKGKNLFVEYDFYKNMNLKDTTNQVKPFYGSITFGHGFNLRKAWELFGSNRMGPQNLFMNLEIHYFTNPDLLKQIAGLYDDIPLGLGVSLEREIYMGIRGLYISPFVYAGLPFIGNCGLNLGYNLNKKFSVSVKKQFIYSSIGVNLKYRL